MILAGKENILEIVGNVHVGDGEIHFQRRRYQRQYFERFFQFGADTTARNGYCRPYVLENTNFGATRRIFVRASRAIDSRIVDRHARSARKPIRKYRKNDR